MQESRTILWKLFLPQTKNKNNKNNNMVMKEKETEEDEEEISKPSKHGFTFWTNINKPSKYIW